MFASRKSKALQPADPGVDALEEVVGAGTTVYAVLEWGDSKHHIVQIKEVTSTGVRIAAVDPKLLKGDAILMHFGPTKDAAAWSTGGEVHQLIPAKVGAKREMIVALDAILAAAKTTPKHPSLAPVHDAAAVATVLLITGDRARAQRLDQSFEVIGRATARCLPHRAPQALLSSDRNRFELAILDAVGLTDGLSDLLKRMRTIDNRLAILVCGLEHVGAKDKKRLIAAGADAVVPTRLGQFRMRRVGSLLLAKVSQTKALENHQKAG